MPHRVDASLARPWNQWKLCRGTREAGNWNLCNSSLHTLKNLSKVFELQIQTLCSEFCELLRSLPQTFFLKYFQPDNDLLRHPPTSGPPMPQWNIMQWLCAWTLFLRLKFQIRNIKDIQLTWQAHIIVQICHFLLLHNFNPKLAHLRRKVVILNINTEIRLSIVTHL